ncbi:major facilitator superfamily domain-containing protein [Mycena capillaripes]|nr:major facilitator superfamily domain-containing protein [Mycena capillaripes]
MSTERDPLLNGQEPEDSASAVENEPASIHLYYIVIVSFLVNLCTFFSETTMVEILLELVCGLYWYYLGDGAHAPFPGDSDKCAHPSVRRYFTMVITLSGVMESAAGLLMYAPMGRLSGKYGRRIMLVGLTAMLIVSSFCMIGAYRLPTPFTAPMLVLWLITMSIAGSSRFSLMTVMYVVDTTSPQQRTAQLSILIGWGYAAGIPGFSLGGALTTYTDSNTAVYWTVIAIAVGLLTFITFVLPESFDTARRAKLQEEWQNEGSDRDSPLQSLLRSLALLKPHRNPITGAWNLRLLWCAVHGFTQGIASGYLWSAVLVYLRLHLGYRPDDNGYVLSTAAVATGVSLIVITPLVIKFGRPFYGERTLLPANNSESITESTRQGTSSGNSKMDRHLAIFGWMIDIVAIALFPLAQTRIQVLIPLVILGASYFRVSAFRSVVVASGDPLRSGEIMAAIQTVSGLGAVFSGLVLGSVLSASINTFPGLVFLVYSAIASVSVLALCMIKESDRYISAVQLSGTS